MHHDSLGKDLPSQEDNGESNDEAEELPELGPRLGRSGTEVGHYRQRGKCSQVCISAVKHLSTHMLNSWTCTTASKFEWLFRQASKVTIRHMDPNPADPTNKKVYKHHTINISALYQVAFHCMYYVEEIGVTRLMTICC